MKYEHAHYAPSAADIWMDCGGSTTIDVSDVDDGDQYSTRGDLLHHCCFEFLTHGSYNVPTCKKKMGMEDYEFTDEDGASVERYVGFILSLPTGPWFLEKRTSWIDKCGGTTDCALVNSLDGGGFLLHIIDYKAGFVKRMPRENYQTMIYALGMVKLLAPLYDFKRVRLTIVQPMHLEDDEEPPSWEIPISELLRHGKRIAARVRDLEAQKPKAITFEPRNDRCRFCMVGRSNRCPALDAHALEAAKDTFREHLAVEPDAEPPTYLAKPVAEMTPLEVYEMAGVVEKWAERQKESITSQVKKGTHVEGFKLVAGNRRRSVNDRGGLVEHLVKEGFGEDKIFIGEPVLVSPAQAEKLFKGKGSGAKKKALAEFFHEEPGADVVVPEYDHRPGVEPQDDARRAFADFNREEE